MMNFIAKIGMKYTRGFLKAAFVIAACALLAGSVQAQLPPIPKVTVDPPQLNNPSAFLSDWQGRASTATVKVTNKSGSPFFAKIWVEFFLNGARVAYSQPAKLPFTQITSTPQDNLFNGETLVPLSGVKFENNVDQNSQRAGRIPDGQICIIVHVLNPAIGQESVSPNGCSFILSYSPPTLILPADNSELCKLGNNNVINKTNGQPMPIFQWTPIVPAPQSQVIYHFAIFEVLPGQAPIAAFRSARPLFTQNIPDLTTLLWPTQYFLPEKGKIYTWSVQALDSKGNPFVLQNNGWATPFTFTVGSDCDVNGISGLLVIPPVLDFGSVPVKSGSVTKQITLQNIGNEPLNLQLPTLANGAQFGFSLSAPPTTPIIAPATNATFDVTFNPTQIGMADGSVRIATDGGNATVQLKGQGTDATSPTIKIISPAGGENLGAGSPFTLKFSASDNSVFGGDYHIMFSTDGGSSFKPTDPLHQIVIGNPSTSPWNIPSDAQTQQAIIKIDAQDKSGNTISALSGLFSIGMPGTNTDCGGQPYCAQFISQEIPSCIKPGETVSVSVTMKNTGTETWSSFVALQSESTPASLWGDISATPSMPVLPGSNYTFTFPIRAPSTPGTYTFRREMFDPNSNGLFGQATPAVQIQVTPDCLGGGTTGSLNPTNDWMFIPLGMELLSPNGSPLNVPPGTGNSNHGITMTLNGDGHPPLKLHVVSITAADVNNDGRPDLLLLDDSQGKNTLYLLLRKQDGMYAYPQAINTGK